MKPLTLFPLCCLLAFSTATTTDAQVPGVRRPQGVQNVRLVFHLIEADGFEDTDPAIADIVAELTDVFRFDGYRLLDTSVLRATLAGEPARPGLEVSSRVRQHTALKDHGEFEIEAWVTRTSASSTFRVSVTLYDADADEAYFSSGGQRVMPQVIDASVTVRSGQTVVLGSGRPDSSGGALILAMNVQLDENN